MTTLKDFIKALKNNDIEKFFELLSEYIYVNKALVQAIQPVLSSNGEEGYIIVYLPSLTITIMQYQNKLTVQAHYPD